MNVNWGMILQIGGASIETVGLFLVALGISETRESFPGSGPGTLKKAWRRFLVKLHLTKPKTHTISLSGINAAPSIGSVAFTRGFHWEGDLAARLERVQQVVQEHESHLGQLESRIETEQSETNASIQALRSEIANLKGEVEKRIQDTATSALDREVYGLAAFFVGLALQTWGSVGF